MSEPKRYHTDEQIKTLALDYRHGRLFGSWQVKNPEDWPMVFMPLMFMETAQIEEMRADEVSHVAEYISKASPRSMNGYPMFLSMISLTRADVAALRALVEKLDAAEKAALE